MLTVNFSMPCKGLMSVELVGSVKPMVYHQSMCGGCTCEQANRCANVECCATYVRVRIVAERSQRLHSEVLRHEDENGKRRYNPLQCNPFCSWSMEQCKHSTPHVT